MHHFGDVLHVEEGGTQLGECLHDLPLVDQRVNRDYFCSIIKYNRTHPRLPHLEWTGGK